jgi:peptidoglycan/xylan/chitin deacetylase (PgdA/CDA1 family)
MGEDGGRAPSASATAPRATTTATSAAAPTPTPTAPSTATATAFTVDVERDWAGAGTRGVREALGPLLDLLDRHDATATFFVVGEIVDLVTGLLPPDGPHEVGSHGLTHRALTRMPLDAVRHEVTASRRVLTDRGYAVDGFRAPYFARPAGLEPLLADAGYRYDASFGRLHPFGRRPDADAAVPGALPRVVTGSVRGGLPFGLTSLRLAHPLGPRLVGPRPGPFFCHLHELLDGTDGWRALPPGLRHLHKRASGAPARAVLERLLARPGLRFTSCRSLLGLDLGAGPRPAGVPAAIGGPGPAGERTPGPEAA